MSETASEKSRGLRFAEQQLLRHGWEQGKGLGRAENGISEAIRVKVKCDKGGVGHKESEQFTFHWWDHVFNKASASLAVESDQNGVVVKKDENDEDGMISNKKPRKAMMNKSMLYGSFVKSATLFSGQEQTEQRLSVSEDSSSEDEEKLDLSSTKTLSDAELMMACGGRTAHKGARHGLKMSAKLARLEQQEQEFMAKYGKKQTDKATPLSEAEPTEASSALDQERAEKIKQKKAKKKKQRSVEPRENSVQDNTDASQEHNEEISKKRKKQSKDKAHLESEVVADPFVDTNTKKKKKKTKLLLEEESTGKMQEGEVAETAEHQPTDDSVSEKKKKKKKNHSEKSGALEEGQNRNTALDSKASAETTESYEPEQQEEGTAALHSTPDDSKTKKKKSSKANKGKSPAPEMDGCYSLDASTAETEGSADVEKGSSQSKKRKSRREELEADAEIRSIEKPNEKKKKKKKHAD